MGEINQAGIAAGQDLIVGWRDQMPLGCLVLALSHSVCICEPLKEICDISLQRFVYEVPLEIYGGDGTPEKATRLDRIGSKNRLWQIRP